MTQCKLTGAIALIALLGAGSALAQTTEIPRLGQGQPAPPNAPVLLTDQYDVGKPKFLRDHKTILYVPQEKLPNGKRGLLVVLAGCNQTAKTLWQGGNLKDAAKQGLVVAVPYLGNATWGASACWDYDVNHDYASVKADSIINLTVYLASPLNTLMANIDPNHIYVTGLSSGGAFSQLLGCKAPDIYAGVGSVAGPSVGSDQKEAASKAERIKYTFSAAIESCRSLAKSKAGHSTNSNRINDFTTQIANISYGNMDKDGDKDVSKDAPHYDYTMNMLGESMYGKIPFVSTKWSQISSKAMATIYGFPVTEKPDLVPANPIDSGNGKELSLTRDNKARLALLEIANVGHAWPAGSGEKQSPWIATQGLNYPSYIANWFISNNVRTDTQLQEIAVLPGCVEIRATPAEHLKAGRAYERAGIIYAAGSGQPLHVSNSANIYQLANVKQAGYVLGYCQ